MKYLRDVKEAFHQTVKHFLAPSPKLDIMEFPPTTNEEHLILSFVDDIWRDEPMPVYVIRDIDEPIGMLLGITWRERGNSKGEIIAGVVYINGNQDLKQFGNTYINLLGGTKATRRLLHAKMKEAHIG